MKKTKSKVKQRVENPLEAILSSFNGSISDADKYTGHAAEKRKGVRYSGDLSQGQTLNLKEIQKEQEEKILNIEAGINYAEEIVHVGERAVNHENKELEAQLREIMAEIKKLADSSKELQMEFREVAVEQYVAKPGKYHKSFFTWLLSVIRAARTKVEDSGAWLQAMHSKKKSREYAAMAKKQGTSFTLNNERTVATQVG